MSSNVSPDTLLARFELDKHNIKKQPPPAHPKPKMFMPYRDKETGQLALSTFRIDGLNDGEIWELGDREVASKRGRELKGRADLSVETYARNGLIVNVDDHPPRHVNIEGWPPEEDKSLQIAQELAAVAAERSAFHLYPK